MKRKLTQLLSVIISAGMILTAALPAAAGEMDAQAAETGAAYTVSGADTDQDAGTAAETAAVPAEEVLSVDEADPAEQPAEDVSAAAETAGGPDAEEAEEPDAEASEAPEADPAEKPDAEEAEDPEADAAGNMKVPAETAAPADTAVSGTADQAAAAPGNSAPAEAVPAPVEKDPVKTSALRDAFPKTASILRSMMQLGSPAVPAEGKLYAADAKTHAITVNVVTGEGAVSGMYAMDSAVVTELDDGTYLVRMHQTSVNRNYMALTDDKEAAKAHTVDWYIAEGDDGYWYVIPVEDLSQPIKASFSSASRVADGKDWSNIMTISFDVSSMTDTDEPAVTKDELNIDPAEKASKTYAIAVSVVNAEGTASGMYAMEDAVVTELDDGTYLVRMHQSALNRDYMALTDDKDAAKAHTVDWYIAGGDDGYWFVIPVENLSNEIQACFSSASRVADGKDWSNIMTISFDVDSMTDTDEPDVTEDEMNIDPAVTAKTHAITVSVVNAEGAASGMYAMDNAVVTELDDGTYLVRMHQTSVNRDYMALTDDKDAAKAHTVDWYIAGGDDGYWFVIPVENLSDEIQTCFSSASRVADGKDWSNVMTISFDEESMTDTDEPDVTEDEMNIDPAEGTTPDPTPTVTPDPTDTPTPDPTDTPTPDPTDTPTPDPTEDPTGEPVNTKDIIVADAGEYPNVQFSMTGKMFRVVNAVLKSDGDNMTAIVTLSGTGYISLYPGTEAEAAAAKGTDPSKLHDYIGKSTKSGEGYIFEIPVAQLDKDLPFAAFSEKNQIWYPRTIRFSSAGIPTHIKKVEDDGKPDPTPIVTPEAEQGGTVPANTNGTTAAVDSSTELADGEYTPDAFTFAGGTGKVVITCTKVTVKGGQAFATIVFSSSKYSYVKAAGGTYYPITGNGTSTFTIPVELNKNNKIIGLTTAMSQAHEIEYTIFVYLAGANAISGNSASGMVSTSNEAMDEEAPEIVGLEYESETKVEYAEYFKIYNYKDGVVLLEIDMTKDTARDPAKQKKDEDKDSGEDAEAPEKSGEEIPDASEEEQPEEDKASGDSQSILDDPEGDDSIVVKTPQELTAELYMGNVVKYLLVPDGVEVPVGLDRDMVVIPLSEETDFSAYLASVAALGFIDELDELDIVSALGLSEDMEALQPDPDDDEETAAKKEAQLALLKEILLKLEPEADVEAGEDSDTDAAGEGSDADAAGEDAAESEKKAPAFAGEQTDPDYKQMVLSEITLAFLDSAILPAAEDEDGSESEAADDSEEGPEEDTDAAEEDEAGTDKMTAEEETERLQQITEKLAMLNIAVLIDRSYDEKTELGRLEWIKLYGALFGKTDAADEMFKKAVKDAETK